MKVGMMWYVAQIETTSNQSEIIADKDVYFN